MEKDIDFNTVCPEQPKLIMVKPGCIYDPGNPLNGICYHCCTQWDVEHNRCRLVREMHLPPIDPSPPIKDDEFSGGGADG